MKLRTMGFELVCGLPPPPPRRLKTSEFKGESETPLKWDVSSEPVNRTPHSEMKLCTTGHPKPPHIQPTGLRFPLAGLYATKKPKHQVDCLATPDLKGKSKSPLKSDIFRG